MFVLILDEDRQAVVTFIYDSIAQIGPVAKTQRIGVCAVNKILEIKVGSKSAKSFKIGINSHFFCNMGIGTGVCLSCASPLVFLL